MNEIHQATASENHDWLQACLNSGDPVDTLDEDGYTPLLRTSMRARLGNSIATAALLLDAGADPDSVVAPSGSSCLQLAIEAWSGDMVQLLLSRGADPSKVADEVSPLMCAIRSRQTEIADQLLAAGADVNLRVHGLSAVEYAVYEGFSELAEKIRSLQLSTSNQNSPGGVNDA